MPKRSRSSSEIHSKISAEMPPDMQRQTGFTSERKALRREQKPTAGGNNRMNGDGGGKSRGSGRRRRRGTSDAIIPESEKGTVDRVETLSLVCRHFCAGKSPLEIKKILEEKHAVVFTRETIYKVISYAAKNNMIHFRPPTHFVLAEQLKRHYPWLHDVSVVQTASTVDVARATARELLVLVKRCAIARAERGEPRRVHIGLAGGVAMRDLASELSDLLCEPDPSLPDEITLHALVAGFDLTDPLTDPNGFFAFFHRPDLAVDVSFVGFYGPALADGRAISGLEHLETVSAPQEAAKAINIIVTSGGAWADEHSLLYKSLKGSADLRDELKARACVGDILWHPIGKNGPIEIDGEKLHAFTAVRLTELPNFIAKGRHVLLMMGPCVQCGEPKSDLLKTALDLERHFITHLVVDSGTAARVAKTLPR